MKIGFFDRDGTIIEDYLDHEWTNINEPVFLPNAIETLKSVNKKDMELK